MEDGSKICRLVLSKSRLGPLAYKGETVRNELSGATLSSRLKQWVQKNSEIEFGQFYHFLDSQIVKDMLAKDSYGFNTFFGLRVAEVQQRTSYDDWKHIPSATNISDILTKGAPPNLLGPQSVWQNGPSWLKREESSWPVSVQPVRQSAERALELEKFSRKSVALLSVSTDIQDGLDILINRCSSLSKLLRSVAYVMRWLLPARNANKVLRTGGEESNKLPFKDIRPVSASEQVDAMNVIVALGQRRRLPPHNLEKLVPKLVRIRLNN